MDKESIKKLSHQELIEAIKIINSFLEYLEDALNVGEENDW